MYINLVVRVIDIEEDLRRFTNSCDSLEGVAVAYEREIGQCIELVQVRTGEHEKVADHEVSGPCRQEVRERIKDIINALPFLSRDVVYLRGKGFESAARIELIDGNFVVRFHKRFVLRKTHVYNPLVFRKGAADIMGNKKEVVFDFIDLPDHVVAGTETVDDAVEAFEAGADSGQ